MKASTANMTETQAETSPTEALSEVESDAARWKALLHDPEFMDALLAGVPKRPFREREPGECPVLYMFELFPLVRTN
jgi:hypothetical protein